MGEDIRIQCMGLAEPAGSRAMVQQTNTYVTSPDYLQCSTGKAIKITFKQQNFRDIKPTIGKKNEVLATLNISSCGFIK